MSRRLVLLRHGQTTFNADRRIQGQLDAPLSGEGHHQARVAAAGLAGLDPVLVWSSDLARAADTAAYVAEACGLEAVPDPRLREFHLGERQGTTHEEYAAAHPEEHATYLTGRYDVAAGAEPASRVLARMGEVLRELLAATPAQRCSVAVAHGAAIKLGIAAMTGCTEEALVALAPLGNAHRAVLEEGGRDGIVRLVAYNLPPDFASSGDAR